VVAIFQRTSDIMSKQAIHTAAAPAAIGTYSQAIRAGDLVFLSGQIGLDPASGQLRDALMRRLPKPSKIFGGCASGGRHAGSRRQTDAVFTDLAHLRKLTRAWRNSSGSPIRRARRWAWASLPRARCSKSRRFCRSIDADTHRTP